MTEINQGSQSGHMTSWGQMFEAGSHVLARTVVIILRESPGIDNCLLFGKKAVGRGMFTYVYIPPHVDQIFCKLTSCRARHTLRHQPASAEMTGVREQFSLKQGPHIGLSTPNKGQHIMQARAGSVGLQRRDTSSHSQGVGARHHSHSDKKPVKHPDKAFHRESSYSASFGSHELVTHPLPATRCDQLRRQIDPRGHLLEVLSLCAPYDQDHPDGDSMRRDKGPKLANTISFEGHREPVTRIVSPNPLRPLARIRNASSFLASATSSTDALQRKSTSIPRLRSEELPLLFPSERSDGSGEESPRKSSCCSHDNEEHAASSPIRPPSPGPPLTLRPSEAARPAGSPSEGRIQIVWQLPSSASIMRDLNPEHANSLPTLVFSARRGQYWDPHSVC